MNIFLEVVLLLPRACNFEWMILVATTMQPSNFWSAISRRLWTMRMMKMGRYRVTIVIQDHRLGCPPYSSSSATQITGLPSATPLMVIVVPALHRAGNPFNGRPPPRHQAPALVQQSEWALQDGQGNTVHLAGCLDLPPGDLEVHYYGDDWHSAGCGRTIGRSIAPITQVQGLPGA